MGSCGIKSGCDGGAGSANVRPWGRLSEMWLLLACAAGLARVVAAASPRWERVDVGAIPGETGPEARARHALELWGNTVIVYGGEGSGGNTENDAVELLGDMWALNLPRALEKDYDDEDAEWEIFFETTSGRGGEVGGVPSARSGVASAVSPDDDTFFVFGGWTAGYTGYNTSDELWAFDLSTKSWEKVASWNSDDKEGPSPRQGATGAYYEGSFLVLGGTDFLEEFSELWAFDVTARTWRALSTDATIPAWGHASAIVPAPSSNPLNMSGDVLVVFGGASDYRLELTTSDANAFLLPGAKNNLSSALRMHLDLSPEVARSGHSMVADSRGLLWVYGGMKQYSSDLVFLTEETLAVAVGTEEEEGLGSQSSLDRKLRGLPRPRKGRAYGRAREALHVHHALATSSSLEDGDDIGSSLSLESASWMEIQFDDSVRPGLRMDHRAIVWEGNFVLYGGRVSSAPNDVSSTMWSLAVDVEGVDAIGSLVAYGATDDEESWISSNLEGVISSTLILLATGWIAKRLCCCALRKIRGENAAVGTRNPEDGGLAMAGVVAAGPSAQARPSPSSRRQGLSPTEIARLPLQRYSDAPLLERTPELAPRATRTYAFESDPLSLVARAPAAGNFWPGEGEDQGEGAGSSSKENCPAAQASGRSTDSACAICLCDYESGCLLRVMMPCSHSFHASCVDEWLQRRDLCPVCKVTVRAPPAAAVRRASRSSRSRSHGARQEREGFPTLAEAERSAHEFASASVGGGGADSRREGVAPVGGYRWLPVFLRPARESAGRLRSEGEGDRFPAAASSTL